MMRLQRIVAHTVHQQCARVHPAMVDQQLHTMLPYALGTAAFQTDITLTQLLLQARPVRGGMLIAVRRPIRPMLLECVRS